MAKMDAFQSRIFNVTQTVHPLAILGPDLQPDLLANQLNQFDFRAKVALSCLFEDGTAEGQKLMATIDMLKSALTQKWSILQSILEDKMADVGGSLANHACLAIK